MLKKRIIPIQLLNNTRLVKSKQFNNFRDVGDPVKSSKIYTDQEVDELLLLNIDRNNRNVRYLLEIVDEISKSCFVPFSVGGGIKSYDDAKKLFDFGADKVVLNSVTYENLEIVKNISNNYGSQAVVVSIDIRITEDGKYQLFSNCGKKFENVSLLEHINNIEKANIGEIIIQCINLDGMMTGYNFDLIKYCINNTNVPLIAASGAGDYLDLKRAFDCGVDAVACGSLFNFGDNNPLRAKSYLKNYGVPLKNIK